MPEAQEQTRATPGPWMIAYWPIPHPNWWIGTPPTHPGSSRLGPSVCGMIHVEANAYLIAASPTMFDALEAAPVIRLGETFDEFAVRYKQWHREIRVPAVNLAKAEGR
jgi:hypothetical protein